MGCPCVIAEIGHFALVLAFALSIAQGTLPLFGAAKGDARLMAFARSSALGQLLFVAVAFVALTTVFVASDFSVSLVAQHSHSAKPLIYKISGVWGNHEGSMLLWVLILAVFGGAVAAFARNLPNRQGAVVAGTLEQNMTFIQNLTEAASRRPRTMVVASIPESDQEIGGPAGQAVLGKIENVFKRVERPWTPVESGDAFEVVR